MIHSATLAMGHHLRISLANCLPSKLANTSLFHFEELVGFFRLSLKGIFDACLLLDKKLIFILKTGIIRATLQ